MYRSYYDGATQPDIQQWFGDAIQLVIQNKLSSGINDKNTLSEAGLYAVQYQYPSFSGIGFSISRSIVEAHQGKITARSLSEGGAEFLFELPEAEDD